MNKISYYEDLISIKFHMKRALYQIPFIFKYTFGLNFQLKTKPKMDGQYKIDEYKIKMYFLRNDLQSFFLILLCRELFFNLIVPEIIF